MIEFTRYAIKTEAGFMQDGQVSYATFGALETAKLYRTEKAAKVCASKIDLRWHQNEEARRLDVLLNNATPITAVTVVPIQIKMEVR